MAFRRFTEAETPQPEGMPYTAHAVSGLVDSINRRRLAEQTAKRNALQQYKGDTFKSKYAQDQDDFTKAGQLITQRSIQDINNTGQIQAATTMEAQEWAGRAAESEAQFQLRNDLEKKINSLEFNVGGKNYYRNQSDYDNLVSANNGPDVYYGNRTEKLQDFSKTIGKDLLKSFDNEGYLSDYVERAKTQSIDTSNKSMSGFEKSGKREAIFWNKNGVPEVTDEHAINYLQSNPYTTGFYQQKLNQQLLSEAKRMMATPDGAKLKGLTEEQIIAGMRTTPDDPNYIKNTINDLAPGIRERNMAKIDLEKKQRVNLTNSTDASSVDPNAAKGIRSKYFTVSPSFDPNVVGGPGWTFSPIAGGKHKTIKLQGQAYDTNEGRLTGNDRSSRDMVIKGGNLMLVNKETGVPLNIPAKDIDGQVAFINSMSPKDLEKYDLKTGIKGQAFNRSNVISNARLEYNKFKFKPNKTESDKSTMESIGELLHEAEINPDLEPEVFQAALGALLPTIVEDVVKPVDSKSPELAEIKNTLGGYDPTDPKNYDSDQKAFSNAYYTKLASKGTVKPPEEKSKKTAKFPLPKGQAETVNQNGFEYTWDYETGQYR